VTDNGDQYPSVIEVRRCNPQTVGHSRELTIPSDLQLWPDL